MLLDNHYQNFIGSVTKIIDSTQVITDPLLCHAYGTDASMYQITPKIVIFVKTTAEVQHLISCANFYKIAITFRAAGTSLSGQSVTNQVLIVLDNNSWQDYTILENGKYIRLSPGIIGSQANLYLKPYNTKIGPDPASLDSCKIGGIVANNSSGMCCGVYNNTYHTMKEIQCILANGNILDSSDKLTFKQQNSALVSSICDIRDQIRQDINLCAFIKRKFQIKNTCGFSLNSFIDFDDPVDILAHLMIGSEGTLGFINNITYSCIENDNFKAVSLIYCNNISDLINLALQFDRSQINALELLDASSLSAIKNLSIKSYLPELNGDIAAILIEISGISSADLEAKTFKAQTVINNNKIISQIPFTQDHIISNDLWRIRKGILPIIGGNRPPNTTVIIEDIAVNMTDLPLVINDLRILFKKYNYLNAAIFGHILTGNIHFVFTPSFTDQSSIKNYSDFMSEMSELICIKYEGSLKAEHGTGRNIAPFVKMEWGDKAYQFMWQIKSLLDPNHILNPDVILSNDPQIHLKNLKQIPKTHPIIDKCIECGFCETVCPSSGLSLSPRGRISGYRYLSNLKLLDSKQYKKLLNNSFKYNAVSTCATTGLCQTRCPVGINTGKFILDLKHPNLISKLANHLGLFIFINRVILKIAITISRLIGAKRFSIFTNKLNRLFPFIPKFLINTPDIQRVNFKKNHLKEGAKKYILYIPSCNNRIFADYSSTKDSNAIIKLLGYLGYNVLLPDNLQNICCGQLLNSMSNLEASVNKKDHLINLIQQSKYPVIIDNSSCNKYLLENTDQNIDNLSNIVDIIYNNINQLNLIKKFNKIALHIDCSSKDIDQNKILAILNLCSNKVIIPSGINCCGFAGSKGFKLPNLNQYALSSLASQIKDCDCGVTFNRNCQIGLSEHGKKNYFSISELVLQCIPLT